MYTRVESQVELMLNMGLELDVVSDWIKTNKLTLHTNKTKYVISGSKIKTTTCRNFRLKIEENLLEQAPVMKYLGMMLDEKLIFNNHIEFLYGKAVNKLGILRKSRNCLDQKTSIPLYKSLVLPPFEYWDLCTAVPVQAILQKTQVLEDSACRTMLFADKRTPIEKMHNDFKLLTSDQSRRDLHIYLDCHKHVNIQDSSLSPMFKPKNTRRTRAGANENELLILRTATGRKVYLF